MSFFNFFGTEKKDKEYISDQRIIHFTIDNNPEENDYTCIPFNKNITCEEIINNETFKKKIEERFHGQFNLNFHFSIIDPKNKFTELKLHNKDKPYKYLGFEYMLCYLPDNNKKVKNTNKEFENTIFNLIKKPKKKKNENNLIISNKTIYKWNSILNKFEKLKGTLTNDNLFIERNPVFKMEISNDFIVNSNITSCSEEIRKNINLNGNENLIEIIYQGQPLIFNCYKKENYSIWVNNLDNVVINYKLMSYENLIKDKLNEYNDFKLALLEKNELIDYIIYFYLLNKIWEDFIIDEKEINNKNIISLLSFILKYKNLIKNKKFIEGWMIFIQILCLIENLYDNLEKNSNNENIKIKFQEYINLKIKIHLEIQKFQNNLTQITNELLSEFFKIELFDDLIEYILSKQYWIELKNNLEYLGNYDKGKKVNNLTNKLSKFMASKFMNENNFHQKEFLEFNDNFGTISSRYKIFNKLKKGITQ